MDRDNWILWCMPHCTDRLPKSLIKWKTITLQSWATVKDILLLLDDPDVSEAAVPFVSHLFNMNNPNKKWITTDEQKFFETNRQHLIDIFWKEY